MEWHWEGEVVPLEDEGPMYEFTSGTEVQV